MNSIQIFDSKVNSPFVTIAIPTYKRAAILEEAIQSAFNQDVEEQYEILVCDNNPDRNDDTEQLMNKYMIHQNVAYYKNEINIGGLNNWNRLFELAKGRYVVLLHDDDLLYPYYLKIVLTILYKTNFEYSLVYPQSQMSHERHLPIVNLPNRLECRKMYPQDYVVRPLGLVSGMCILKNIFLQTGGFRKTYSPVSDQDFLFRALSYCRGVRILSLPMLHYCISENNDSANPVTIQNAIIQSERFFKSFRTRTCWPWRWYTYLCYRIQMEGLFGYWSHFGKEDIINDTKKLINYKNSKCKDKLSRLLWQRLRVYLYHARTFYIELQ